MSKNYTTKTANLRATKADIGVLNVKRLKILEGADLDGIVLPTDYYQFIGRTSLSADEKYTLLNDDAKEIYYTYKQTVTKLIDGTKMYMNATNLETWSDNLQYLEIGDNMFAKSSIITFDTTLPSLVNGDEMFANSSLSNFSTTELPLIESAIGMFRGCPLSESMNVSAPMLTTTTQMFANSGTEDNGINVTISLTRLDDCDEMFINSFIDTATISSSDALNANKMFYKAKAAKTTSTINLTNINLYNADNMFVGWNGLYSFPETLTNLTSANYAFSETTPFNGGGKGTPISTNKFTVSFPASLTSANGLFYKAVIDNPQINLSACSSLSNRNDIFKECSLRTSSAIDITNNANTSAANYVILPSESSSMDYSNYFNSIDASESPIINVIINTVDNCSLNLSSFCENSTFNQFNFHPFNNDDFIDNVLTLNLTNAFKGVNAQNLTLNIEDIIADTTTNVTATSAFENGVITELSFTANKINDASKLFKNAQITTITNLNINDIVNGDEAFLNAPITSIGINNDEGIGLASLTSGNSMFEGCDNVSVTYPITMSQLQKGNRMFYGCSAPSLEINESSLREVESMFENSNVSYVFTGTDTQIDETTTIKTITNLTAPQSLRNTFKNCTELTHPMKGYEADDAVIPERNSNISRTEGVLNLLNAKDAESMFEGCVKLKFLDVSGLQLTSIKNMFKGCINLTRASFNTSALVDGTNAFQDCTSLVEIDLDEMKITGLNATLINGDGMFTNDATLNYKIDENNSTFTTLELGKEMFKNTTLNYSGETNPESYITSNSTLSFPKLALGREMFENANLTTIDIILPHLQDGSGMFKNSSLSNFSAEHENQLKNLVGAADMFRGCPLSEDAVISILTALKSNTGLTSTKLSNNSYEPIISNSAKAVITNYDVNTYNDANTIGVMNISCNSTDISAFVGSLLGVCVDEIVSSSQT